VNSANKTELTVSPSVCYAEGVQRLRFMSQESTTQTEQLSPMDTVGTEIEENRARIVFDPEAPPWFRTLVHEQLATADLLTTERRSTDEEIIDVELKPETHPTE